MKIGTLVRPKRTRGIPLSLITPDIRNFITMNLNQVGLVLQECHPSGGTWIRLLVGGVVGDGYLGDFEVLWEPVEENLGC